MSGRSPVTVVLADDHPIWRDGVRADLADGFTVVGEASTADEAIAAIRRHQPDLVVLNRDLPDEDGLALCSSLRASAEIPIVVRGAAVDRPTIVQALKLGADDVLRESCEPDEVLARIEAILRRARSARVTRGAPHDSALRVGPLAIDQARCRVSLHGQPIRLTPMEYRVLLALATHPGQLLSRPELERLAWGARRPARGGRRIDVCMHRLRQRLVLANHGAPVPSLTAVRGYGYRLVVPS